MQTASNFRSDINGLRAWAVIAVVCYHFKLPGFTGGFIGVDIFFVISGFLMTGIVSRSLLQQRFSLWQFYRARALRIAPSLLLVCLACAAAGYIFLFNDEYRALLKQSVYSLLFISNHYFNSTGDYFSNSTQQPLLHTWSLSIEWQFYLLLPIALLLSARFNRSIGAQIFTLLALSALSVGAIIYAQAHQHNSFYPLATRGWELLLGGLLYFACLRIQLKKWAQALAFYSGFVLIVASIALMPASNWPNPLTLVPLLGTCLIILAAQQHNPLTANRLAQQFGTLSYTLYLWHWPLYVYLVLLIDQPTALHKTIAITLAIVLAAISHYTVEQYFLKRQRRSKASEWILAACYIALIAGCYFAYKQGDFSYRLSDDVKQTLRSGNDKNPYIRKCSYREDSLQSSPYMPCTLQAGELSDADPTVILLGDSHAAALAGPLSTVGGGTAVKMYTAYACPPILGLRSGDTHYSCPRLLPPIIDEITRQHRGAAVVIYSRLNSYFVGFNETEAPLHMDFQQLAIDSHTFGDAQYQRALSQQLVATLCRIAENHPVTVITPTPELGFDPVKRIARDKLLGLSKARYGVSEADQRVRSRLANAALQQAQQQCAINIFDPTPYLCRDNFCAANDDTSLRYFDDDHLSQYGASLFASALIKALNLDSSTKNNQ